MLGMCCPIDVDALETFFADPFFSFPSRKSLFLAERRSREGGRRVSADGDSLFPKGTM